MLQAHLHFLAEPVWRPKHPTDTEPWEYHHPDHWRERGFTVEDCTLALFIRIQVRVARFTWEWPVLVESPLDLVHSFSTYKPARNAWEDDLPSPPDEPPSRFPTIPPI